MDRTRVFGKAQTSVFLFGIILGVNSLASMGLLTKSAECSVEKLKAKDIDVVVYGVTGFTGHRVANYLASHPSQPTWAMGGRSMRKMKELQQRIAKPQVARRGRPNAGPGVEMFVAHLTDRVSLMTMTNRAKVVLNFAGPYEEYGSEALISAAIDSCTHYVDVTGETHWKAQILERYGPRAKELGVAIVQGAGGSVSLLADFIALSASRDMDQDQQGSPTEIFIKFTKMNGFPGGASVAATKFAVEKYGEIFDPYLLSPETPIDMRVDTKLDGMTNKSFNKDKTLRWYPQGRIDCLTVRRTMNQAYPNVAISVREAETYVMDVNLHQFINDTRMYSEPPDPNIKPGQGPPEWMQHKGSFAAEAWALRSHDGKYTRVAIQGQGDPVFTGTSKMTSELALAIAENGPADVGYVTPALAVDSRILEKRIHDIDNGGYAFVTHGTCARHSFRVCEGN